MYDADKDRYVVAGHEDDEDFQNEFWARVLYSLCDSGYVSFLARWAHSPGVVIGVLATRFIHPCLVVRMCTAAVRLVFAARSPYSHATSKEKR